MRTCLMCGAFALWATALACGGSGGGDDSTITGASAGTTGDGTTAGATTAGSDASDGSDGSDGSGTDGTSGTDGALCQPGETRSCYPGPPATEGVGQCVAGLERCDASGMAFGPCIDAITPTAEDCASPADEDCDGDPGCPPDPDHAWSELFLATQYSSGDALAVGPGGRVVVAGQFRGTFFPGAETHSAPTGDGLDRVYVAAYDDDGAPLWSRSHGGDGQQAITSVAFYPDGGLVLTGFFEQTITFGGDALVSQYNQINGVGNLFVARLGPDGAPLWGRSYPEAAAQLGVAIAATDDGAVLLAGRHGGAVDLGGGPLAGDHFVARLDGDGAHLWSLGLDAVISDLAALPGGDVVLGGQFSGALDLGGGPLMTTSPQAIFVARLDVAGQQVWSRAFEDNGNYPHLLDLAAAPEGDALAVGFFRKEIAFGGPALVNKTQVEHVFAVRLDGDGGHRWSREFGSFVDQTAEAPPRAAIAAAPGGATAFVADFLGEVDLGGGPEESVSDSRDIFVGLYDPQGEHLWSRRYGGPLFNQARGVATDEGGHVVLTGQSRGLLDFGGEPLENRGPADMFVAELDPG